MLLYVCFFCLLSDAVSYSQAVVLSLRVVTNILHKTKNPYSRTFLLNKLFAQSTYNIPHVCKTILTNSNIDLVDISGVQLRPKKDTTMKRKGQPNHRAQSVLEDNARVKLRIAKSRSLRRKFGCRCHCLPIS